MNIVPLKRTLSFRPRPPGARKKSLRDRLREEEGSNVKHGYFKSFDGTKLFYSIEGQGKPLIFCYGLVCSSLHWTYQIEHFRKNYKTIWFDYRGHQNSEVPKDLNSLSLESLGKDLGALLDELKIEDAVFLGHSMGVNVVLELYRQQPKRVAGMILANGTAKKPLETLLHVNAFEKGFDLLRKANQKSPAAVRFFWNLQRNNPVARTVVGLLGFNPYLTSPEDIQLYVDQVAEMDPEIFINLIGNYDRYNATSWLHTVKAPTLIIAGENDKVIPVQQQELMHQLIPGSELALIKHGSHCPQMDLPELVNLRIENFLRQINYTGAVTEVGAGAAAKAAPASPEKSAGGATKGGDKGKKK